MQKNREIPLNNLPKSVKTYIKHLEQVRSDFVANVSHELRTPLAVIHGYLETLIHNDNYEISYKKIFLQMHQHSIRMADIIDDLLLLSHLESDDHFSDEKIKINVAETLKTLCIDAKNISGEKQHKITLKAMSNVFITGSENQLRSLFSNIIVNAIKYTPDKGSITVEWYLDEKGRGVFKVTDTGIGIAKENIPRITERFYRVEKARSRERGGTGLGLAIVKHVLLRHDAELQIESVFEKGSIFTCIFPTNRIVVDNFIGLSI
ncbi:sensor histidine kinase [Legionella steigerwaltii]|uniref:histidine kinase n=1 Tax=Legionella steigerwaltii TaxID=460 RepID=A0A378LCI8_9GAMM|nr:ATP-binding protein [Legionella steigerwaltii]KTD77795.1 sensor histidine kinase [Legionella steigerwaltii]STY24434.1 sensor histidine kinase [Legionella steigerwaltii]